MIFDLPTVPVAIPAGNHEDRRGTEKYTFFRGSVFECEIAFVREACGFSVFATELPGAVSQGDTIEEAAANIAEALSGVLAQYLQDGAIPWSKSEIDGEIVCRKRILVNV